MREIGQTTELDSFHCSKLGKKVDYEKRSNATLIYCRWEKNGKCKQDFLKQKCVAPNK